VSGGAPAIDVASVQQLISRWWFSYDQGDFDELTGLLTDDVHFACRTDSGATDYEEFVRADLQGRDEVMAWQRHHRLDSPYPLRHQATNVHLVATSPGQATFASYLFVTQIAGGVSNLSSGIVRGGVRAIDGVLHISELDVTLDTTESRPLREVRATDA
jgi:hypothetical protein